MTARAQRRGLGAVFFWLAMSAALGAAAYWQWHQPPATVEVADAAGAASEVAPLAPMPSFTAPAFGEFAESLERPLFSPTRRPAPPEAEPEVPPGTPTGDFILIGVVIGPTERLALVQQKGEPAAIRIALGQIVNGWTLDAVEADRVIFRLGEGVQEVKLRDDVPAQRGKRRPGANQAQPAQDQASTPPPAPVTEPVEPPDKEEEG